MELGSGSQWRTTFAPVDFLVGMSYRIVVSYSVGERALKVQIKGLDGSVWAVPSVTLTPEFKGFSVTHFAVASFSDKDSGGAILARGTVDSITLTLPDAVEPRINYQHFGKMLEVSLNSMTGWQYDLEVSSNLASWRTVQGPVVGTGNKLRFNAMATTSEVLGFLRVRGERLTGR